MPVVSVCIPIYNCSRYIEQCACSLFEQTLQDIEYVFVDDCSQDESIEKLTKVLSYYPHRKAQVIIVQHTKNQCVSRTRKDAVIASTGDYVIHCDADDWVEPQMYEKLYSLICKSKADMVYCSFFREMADGSSMTFRECQFETPKEMIKAFFWGNSHGSLWNKLYRRELVNDLITTLPDEICMCEDQRLNVQVLLRCKNIVCCPDVLYHYRANQNSITSGGRSRQSFQAEIFNVNLYDLLLSEIEFEPGLTKYKQELLIEGCISNGIPAKQWHSLWKSTKKSMLFTHNYCFTIKCMFLAACMNFALASWLWRTIKKWRGKECRPAI